MYLQLKNYHMANEILYVLDAARQHKSDFVSKLSLQKILFLSGALSPIREIVLAFMKYITYFRGPYSKDIQNAIDHLVAVGLVDISKYSFSSNGREFYANYNITEGGLEAVRSLCCYSAEEEKYWWISVVWRLSQIYIQSSGLSGSEDERIMKLVYQEPSYKALSSQNKQRHRIDMEVTRRLISFLKEYTNIDKINTADPLRRKAETLVLAFFEYLYLNYINGHSHG